MIKNKFAFIAHPDTLDRFLFIHQLWSPIFKYLSNYRIKSLIPRLSPYVIAQFKSLEYQQGHLAGDMILCPLLPEHFVMLDRSFVLSRIQAAVDLARQRGAEFIGLGGFTSIFSHQGLDVLDDDIYVTTGNSFTAAMAVDGILKAIQFKNLEARQLRLSVVGATGDIGRVCCQVLSPQFESTTIFSRTPRDLEKLKQNLDSSHTSGEIHIANDLEHAVSNVDVILTCTSAITTIIKKEWLKPQVVICDVSIPPNISRKMEGDSDHILAFEGGCAEFDFFPDLSSSFKRFFRFDSLFGCLSETMILAMSDTRQNFSVGRGQITPEKVDRIRQLGQRCGFQVSPLFCGQDRIY